MIGINKIEAVKMFFLQRLLLVTRVLSSAMSDYYTLTWIAYNVDVLKLTWLSVTKYYMAWSILSLMFIYALTVFFKSRKSVQIS